MLDQNTDRMWYVIGAVLIGAAIIFAATALFGDADSGIFGKITELLNGENGLLGKAAEQAEQIEAGGAGDGAPEGAINLFSNIKHMPWI